MFKKKVFVTEYPDGIRCGCCLCETTRAYRIGREHLTKKKDEPDGMCGECLMEFIVDRGFTIMGEDPL